MDTAFAHGRHIASRKGRAKGSAKTGGPGLAKGLTVGRHTISSAISIVASSNAGMDDIFPYPCFVYHRLKPSMT